MSPLDPSDYREIIRCALAEDVGRGDITTDAVVEAAAVARGRLIMKSAGVLAGLDVAVETFRQLDPEVTVTPFRRDGDWCQVGESVAEITGNARALVTAERTALNLLQRLCGVATLTRRFVEASNGHVQVLDTRKTTPMLRVLEKYAVRVGGGTNHRMGLDDGVLIKDNHTRLAGGVAAAVSRVRVALHGRPVEVEVSTLEEVESALDVGADVLLLDNMDIALIRQAVGRARTRAKTEISGGVSLERMPEIASVGADFVSSGALTHSAPAVDISFEIEPL